MTKAWIVRRVVRTFSGAIAIAGIGLGPPVLAPADGAAFGPSVAAKPSYATIASSATYFDPAGRVIARTPVTTARVSASGPTQPPQGRDGDTNATDAEPVSNAVTSRMATATSCRSGTVCGTPARSGCVTWRVWRTEVHQGITDYRYEVDVHFCWRSRVIQRSSLSVTSSLSHLAADISDSGNTEHDDAFYAYFDRLASSGHLSKYQRHVQYCAGWFCYDREDPWIHEYVHGDGTMYFHTGTGGAA